MEKLEDSYYDINKGRLSLPLLIYLNCLYISILIAIFAPMHLLWWYSADSYKRILRVLEEGAEYHNKSWNLYPSFFYNMNIDLEKFICSCIRKAEESGAIGNMDEVMDGHIFKGALKEQGLTYKNGEIIRLEDDHEEVPEYRYLVYDRDENKFVEVPERPELEGSFDMYVPLGGTPLFVIRHSDHCAYLAHGIAMKAEERDRLYDKLRGIWA